MPNNNEVSKKLGRRTNNSQSAGMSNAPSITPLTPQGAPQTINQPEAENDDARRTSETVLGTSNSRQVIESFQDPREQEEDDLRSDVSLGFGNFEELMELGVPYRASDLPLNPDAYSEITVEFPSCKAFSSYGDSEKGLKKSEKVFFTAGRHFQALKLGEAGLRQSMANSTEKAMSQSGRRKVFSKELAILNELLTKLYCFRDHDRIGFAVQRIILVNLNQRLRARREQAEEDLIMSGDGIPSIPRWGLTGKADEFWSPNDFEILDRKSVV